MTVEQALWLLLVAGVGVGVATLAYGVGRIGRAMASRTQGNLDDKLAKALHLPMAVFAGVIASALALVLLQDRLSATAVDQARRLLIGVFLVLAIWGLIRVVRAGLERAGERHARFQPATRVGSRLVALVLYAVAFLMVLSVYGVSITPLLTGLGIAGLAVALALQDTGANFFAGIWIQTGKSMQPGHYVKVEGQQGLDGYVEEVGWRVTRIRTLGGNAIVIPNNELAQSIVTDFNLPSKDLSVVMTFRSGLEQDPHKVIAALVEEAQASSRALPDSFVQGNEPFAQVSAIAEDSIRYSLILRVPEYVQQWTAQHDVYQRVLERYRREGWRMPYPTRHNYQEPVKPEAHRVPGAPGGLAPRGRPRPRRREEPPTADPRLAEAKRAEQEIAARQRQRQAEQAADGKAKPAEAPKEAAAGASPAETGGERPSSPAEEARERRDEDDARDARAGAAATTRLD